MRKHNATLAIASLTALALASLAAAQDPQPEQIAPGVAVTTSTDAAPSASLAEPELAFEREVFTYVGGGRRDPFKPLTDDDALGPLFEDLTLRMIIYSATAPDQSVAVLADGQKKTYRVRRGDFLGNAAIADIGPKRVVFTVNELGNRRQEILELKPDK